ncbi:F-BAR and double SH3 domains protein 1 [Merluccius polli]|uniref:F-BAR and double SH3 domains protein 1 n=1 Tax=Merluccius polli TaxID=89951 RepID=A0AA47PA11_MERPO|nr:F-BAR and double SH3 domains protein 1 [Merluccius polli]
MQPPPRKVKESQQVKLLFSEQLGKLQTRQQLDTELLDEIRSTNAFCVLIVLFLRSFSKQRAAIEKEYGQTLQRLAAQYQKRDWQRGKTDAVTFGAFSIWRSILDASAKSALVRLTAAEEYRALLGETSRNLRCAKEVRAKRGWEQLQRVQGEVVDAIRELHRIKKRYHHLSHIANVAREKAAEAQARARRNDHGIFHFRTGLQRMSTKLNSRLKECDDRLHEVRNEYLLSLAAVNAHLHHYYTAQLPHIMEHMDGDMYDQLRGHFTLLCDTEISVCLATHTEYSRILDSAAKVTRERNVQHFLQEVHSFSATPCLAFQPTVRDVVNVLQEVCGSGGESSLNKEARKWVNKVAKDYKIISHGTRALQSLESRVQLLPKETGLSVEQRMAEVEETIRKAKVSRVKAEARLALLVECGVGVEEWLGPALRQAQEELEGERRLSEQRRSTGDFSEEEFDLTDLEEFEEEDRDIFVDRSSASVVCLYPAACRVVYDYQASQSDELSIVEGEELQVIEEGDVEDWLKVCNSCGQVGYVPERYVQFLCLPAEDAVQLDCSFSSCISIGNIRSGHSLGMARALFAYQAQSAEELSFHEGALIRLLRCRQGEVDDGFWEGELDGRIGVFPSLVVELLTEEGEEDEEDLVEETLLTPTSPPPGPSCSPPPPAPHPSLAPASPDPRPHTSTCSPLATTLSRGQGVKIHSLNTELQRMTDSPAGRDRHTHTHTHTHTLATSQSSTKPEAVAMALL